MSNIEIKFTCPSCGGTLFEHPENPQDADKVVCVACNMSVSFSEVKKTNRENAVKTGRDIVARLLKK